MIPRRAVYALIVGLMLIAAASTSRAGDAPLELEVRIPLGKVSGRIDHLAIDLQRRRLFVAELGNDSLGVVDLAAGKVQSTMMGLKEPQGVGHDPASDAVFIANAGDGSVRVLRTDDLSSLGRVELGRDADNIRVDTTRRRIVVGYGDGGLAVIDTTARKKTADIALPSHPEGFQIAPDGARAFVNIPDAGRIDIVDLVKGEVSATMPTKGYGGNFPMALDAEAQRLAVVFRRPDRLLVLATTDNAVLADQETCGDADDVFFDRKRRRLYVICGEGLIDIFDASTPSMPRLGRIKTSSGARTGLFLTEFDRLFVAARAGWTEPAAILAFRPQD